MNAGDAGGRKQMGKAAFPGCRTERNSVDQKLVARSTEEHAAVAVFRQCAAEFAPSGLKLRGRAGVAELIQPREFQQDVETAHEGARGLCLGVGAHLPRSGIDEAIPSRFRVEREGRRTLRSALSSSLLIPRPQ